MVILRSGCRLFERGERWKRVGGSQMRVCAEKSIYIRENSLQ